MFSFLGDDVCKFCIGNHHLLIVVVKLPLVLLMPTSPPDAALLEGSRHLMLLLAGIVEGAAQCTLEVLERLASDNIDDSGSTSHAH
jgi:hypothetical protein